MRILAALCCLFIPAWALAQPRIGPEPKQWEGAVDKALGFLKQSQDEQGSWSGKKSPGITGVVLTGALESGRLAPDDPMTTRALKYIESLINPKTKHIAGADPKVQLQNYVTCVNLMALKAANSDKYKTVIADAAQFL